MKKSMNFPRWVAVAVLALAGAANAAGSGIVDKLFLQAGVGAVPVSQQSKAGQVLSVKDFGARGDGVKNDVAAIRLAINAVIARAPATLIFPAGRYKIDEAIGSFAGSDITIDLGGATLDFSAVPVSPGVTLLEFGGVYSGAPVALTANGVEGQKAVSLNSSAFAVGDMVRVFSNTVFDPARTLSKYGELNFITAKPDAASATLALDLMSLYTTADLAKIEKITPVRNITIKNGTMQGPAGNDNHIGLSFRGGINIIVENIKSYDMDAIHVQLVDCSNGKVTKSHFQESNSNATGYGVSFADATQDSVATDNSFVDVRHSLSTNNKASSWGIVRRIAFTSNTVSDSATSIGLAGGDAVDAHAGAEDILIANNVINSSSQSGINIEARSAVIAGNIISNTQGNGITHQNYTALVGYSIVSGNEIRKVFGNYGIAIVPISTAFKNVVVSNNIISSDAAPIRLVGSAGKEFNNLVVSGNSVISGVSNNAIQVDFALRGTISGNAAESKAVGIILTDVQNMAVTGNSINLTGASGSTGYGVRVQGTSVGVMASGNAMRHTGALTAAAAMSFINTTVSYSGMNSNTAQGFTAGTKFSVGTGTGNLAANNIEAP